MHIVKMSFIEFCPLAFKAKRHVANRLGNSLWTSIWRNVDPRGVKSIADIIRRKIDYGV